MMSSSSSSSSSSTSLGRRWIRGASFLALAICTIVVTCGCVAVDINPGTKRKRPPGIPDSANFNSNSNLVHFELHPTASLVEERRRQRRRDRKLAARGIYAINSTSFAVTGEEKEDVLFPREWFHPHSRAVYATLHPSDESDGDYDDEQATLAKHHFRDFVKYRHLSRFERNFRERIGLNLHPNWSGNYSDPRENFLEYHDPYVVFKEILGGRRPITKLSVNSSSPNRTIGARRKQQFKNRKLLKALVGGKFDRYQGVPLSQGYGTHYVHLWVGSPVPQRQSVIVDTGSHYTAFPVTGECNNCGESHHTDPHFDPERSETFRALRCPSECLENFRCEYPRTGVALAQKKKANATTTTTSNANNNSPRCSFSQAYTEGSSWSAYQATDIVYCGGGADMIEAVDPLDIQYSVRFVFGCLKTNTGLFVTQLADGIMGMSAHELTLPKQLYNDRKIEYNMFAMCFRKELGTSKKGVTAGSMTLGGVSSALDTSPMVYARNIREYGWYTVYLQNIYLATNGGTKFLFDDGKKSLSSILEEYNIVPLSGFDPSDINRDRGVIVDSGTTDTYLSSSVRKEFVKAWKKATGMEYSNSPIFLSRSQLERLPTLLIQLQASTTIAGSSLFSNDTESDIFSSKPVLGQVGYLDRNHRNDVLLSIPATSYMEYSSTLKVYTSRLFFTESRGGVLGANAMQGHNILFDWQHGRLGVAQSSCSYDLLASKNDNHGDFGGSGRGGSSTSGADDDCVFVDDGDIAILTQTCLQSVSNHPHSMAICKASDSPTNVEVEGMEIWTLRVENSGNNPSSCEAAIREWSNSIDTQNQIESSTTACTLDGLCHEYRPCHVPCLTAIDYNQKRSKKRQPGTSRTPFDEAVTIPHPVVNRTAIDYTGEESNDSLDNLCKNWIWTACDHSCHQSRISSSSIVTHTNGRYCLEFERERRRCHIGSCGRSDPCIVPFLVHAIFILEKAEKSVIANESPSESPAYWTPHVQDTFLRSLVSAAHHPDVYKFDTNNHRENFLFGEGDVDILVAHPWYGDEEEIGHLKYGDESNTKGNISSHQNDDEVGENTPLGVQLILQISISNPNAIAKWHKSQGGSRSLLQEVGVVWSNFTSVFRGSEATSVCDPFDLYPLAKNANLLSDEILANPTFLSLLVAENTDIYDDGDETHQILRDGGKKVLKGFSSVRLESSWTIGTQIYDDSINYVGPLASTPFYPLFVILYKVFFFMSAIWVCKFLIFVSKSIRLCRVYGIRLKKKLSPYQDEDTESEEETSSSIGNNQDFGICTDSGVPSSEVELAATYLGSKATKRTNSTNTTSCHGIS